MINTLDDWFYPVFSNNTMRWNITITESMLEIANSFSLKEHCKLAIETMSPHIGENPAICFSGGIDSQTVVDSFLFAERTPEIVILKFQDNLNSQDVDHALAFCETRKLKPKIFDIDVIRFLNNKLYDFAISNGISSPQFATHLYFAEKLKYSGYSSAIFGGNCLFQYDDGDWYTPTKEETDWYKYAKNIDFPIIGSFWSQDWRLSLYATICMPLGKKDINYQSKVDGYRNMGYDVIPQNQKYNGFENVKKYYEEMTGDGWTFENEFRVKLQQKLGKPLVEPIKIPIEIQQRINSLKIK